MHPSARTTPPPPSDLVLAQLGRLLASTIFTRSQRLSRFLEFVVELSNAGRGDELKEYAIGVEVFERTADFDPRIDPIVRVQASKLRSKLMEYYASTGHEGELVISIPKGGYAPLFVCAESAPEKPGEAVRASVAVLPFINMSPEPDNEYFSDGLTEEVINALTAVPGLQVVARTSVFRFKGQNHDVREIGKQLNVGTILEGSVRKAGAQLRITAQLVNVADGYHLWSHAFKRELRDIFEVQEEISRAVRKAVAPHFGVPAARRTNRHEPDPVAHEYYLKGRYAQARLMGGSVEQAIQFFEQAIAADPQYARAYAGLADAWFLLAFWGVSRPGDVIPQAKIAAQKALELDDQLAEAHASLGVIQCSYEWNWEAGRRSIERALELDPDSVLAAQAYVNQVLVPAARLDDAIGLQRKVIALDPFLPHPQATLTFLLGIAGKIDEAVAQHAATIATNPHYFFSHGTMALAYEANGMFKEALAEITKSFHASHGFLPVAAALSHIEAENGNVDRAKELLHAVLEGAGQMYVPATDVAGAYSGLRDREQTLAWLNQALDEKAMHLILLPMDPRWRWLHSDPEFDAILHRAGLQLAR